VTDVSVVVWDLGNVLIPWDRRFLYSKLIEDPAELDYFLDNVLTLEENARLDAGTSLPDVAQSLVDRYPEHKEMLEAFATRWSETVGEPIAESVELLGALINRRIRCIALSNWGWDTFESVQKRFDFLDWFEGRIISGYEGVVKPDPAIFELMCDRFSFEPASALFIDDSAKNIAAADALGFHTHLFTDSGLLRQDLSDRGLLNI
jgi:2-haloacid dehalogenase